MRVLVISAATMSNTTVLDTALPYDTSSSEAIYPLGFQVRPQTRTFGTNDLLHDGYYVLYAARCR